MYQQQQAVVMPIKKPRNRTVGDVIPTIFPILLAIFQMIIWFTIIGLESASVYYDAGRGTIYAGYWCSTIFFITWVSMFCYVCCRKSTGCGIYLIIQNIICLIFVIILIVFTSLFIKNPCLCYGILCKIPPWDYITDVDFYPYFVYPCPTRTRQKLPVLKGLLSCAVLMLVSNIIFIVIYIIAYISLRGKSVPLAQNQPIEVPPYQPSPIINSPIQYQQVYLVPSTSEPHYYSPAIETIPTKEIASDLTGIRSERF